MSILSQTQCERLQEIASMNETSYKIMKVMSEGLRNRPISEFIRIYRDDLNYDIDQSDALMMWRLLGAEGFGEIIHAEHRKNSPATHFKWRYARKLIGQIAIQNLKTVA